MSTPQGPMDQMFGVQRPGTIPRPRSGAVIDWTAEAYKQIKGVQDRDRVIARLLDGWHPELANKTDHTSRTRWVRSYSGSVGPFAEMSDGEAAIIRAHQEDTG